MTPAYRGRTLFMGALAGLVGSVVGLILVYIVSVLAIFVGTQDFPSTLLAAVTYLPLMLILIFFLPNLVLGILIGLLLGTMNRPGYLAGFAAGALIGFISVEVCLSVILPLIIAPQPGDFISILTNGYLTGPYGVVLGISTNCFFRWFHSAKGVSLISDTPLCNPRKSCVP
jgi:Na+/proline symporter